MVAADPGRRALPLLKHPAMPGRLWRAAPVRPADVCPAAQSRGYLSAAFTTVGRGRSTCERDDWHSRYETTALPSRAGLRESNPPSRGRDGEPPGQRGDGGQREDGPAPFFLGHRGHAAANGQRERDGRAERQDLQAIVGINGGGQWATEWATESSLSDLGRDSPPPQGALNRASRSVIGTGNGSGRVSGNRGMKASRAWDTGTTRRSRDAVVSPP
jgi:hypothetical protein